MSKKYNTVDNNSYYTRHSPVKANFVDDFIKNNQEIKTILDVGCNNGDISYPLQKKYEKQVQGIDLADNLKLPEDYSFQKVDIVNDNFCNFNDCTLFFSLYHHLFGAHGMEIADDVFMKLLMHTKYLVFDTGNPSEKNRSNHAWNIEIQKHFKTEEELFNHFGIPYTVIGKWNVGGGVRTMVVFQSKDMDDVFNVVNRFQRKLITVNDIQLYEVGSIGELTDALSFWKLEYDGKYYFGKMRHSRKEVLEVKEIENTIQVYNNVDKSKLLKFYGYSQTYGLLYEWVDNIKLIKKKVDLLNMKDVELIEVNGVQKYIDFER